MAILCQEMLPANRKAQCSTIEMKEPERLEDHDEPIELHRAGQLQRSPETMRNIQLFVNNFEDVNLKDDFESMVNVTRILMVTKFVFHFLGVRQILLC